jgi:hypothetical protein
MYHEDAIPLVVVDMYVHIPVDGSGIPQSAHPQAAFHGIFVKIHALMNYEQTCISYDDACGYKVI